MVHRIQDVKAKDNYKIEAVFLNGEIVEYDVTQLFVLFPQFLILKDNVELFENVKVDQGGYGILWNDELDLDSESIWENGVLFEIQTEPDLNHLLAYQVLLARKQRNVTQKELAELTGIYQAEISKLERGIGNPSLNTIKRIADGLNMKVKIDFITK